MDVVFVELSESSQHVVCHYKESPLCKPGFVVDVENLSLEGEIAYHFDTYALTIQPCILLHSLKEGFAKYSHGQKWPLRFINV